MIIVLCKSQTQPTPAWITFSIMHGKEATESDLRWGWLGLAILLSSDTKESQLPFWTTANQAAKSFRRERLRDQTQFYTSKKKTKKKKKTTLIPVRNASTELPLILHSWDSFDKHLVDVSCGVHLSPVVAFLVALHQNKELLGPDGLLPVPQYLSHLRQHFKVSHTRHSQCEHTLFVHAPVMLLGGYMVAIS